MYPGKTVVFFAAILLTACNASNPDVPAKAITQVAPSASYECPSQDFAIFLDAFVGSIEVQKNFTAQPLQSDSIDADAEPEPKQVTAMVSELQFPVMPSDQEQMGQGLVMSTGSAPGNVMVVKLAKPDSDYQISYYFKRDACWTLYRKNDESI